MMDTTPSPYPPFPLSKQLEDSQVVTAVQPCSDLHLYDKLLPWLAGSPLEHLLATVAPSTGATQEWRSRQCAATDGWRYLTFTLRVLLLEVAQFTTSKAKLLKWHLRKELLWGEMWRVQVNRTFPLFYCFPQVRYRVSLLFVTSPRFQ